MKKAARLAAKEGGGGIGADDEDVEGEAFTQGPLQTLLTQLVRKNKRPAAAIAPQASLAFTGPSPKAKKCLCFETPKKTTTPVPKKKKKKKKATPKATPLLVDWGELPFSSDPLMGKTLSDKAEAVTRSLQKKARQICCRCPTETDKLRQPG